MFQILMIVCVLSPIPRGEITNTKCYSVTDKWEPTVHGYHLEEHCEKRINRIRASIKKNFDLYYIKKSYCRKNKYLLS
jgi:hypothetical protein